MTMTAHRERKEYELVRPIYYLAQHQDTTPGMLHGVPTRSSHCRGLKVSANVRFRLPLLAWPSLDRVLVARTLVASATIAVGDILRLEAPATRAPPISNPLWLVVLLVLAMILLDVYGVASITQASNFPLLRIFVIYVVAKTLVVEGNVVKAVPSALPLANLRDVRLLGVHVARGLLVLSVIFYDRGSLFGNASTGAPFADTLLGLWFVPMATLSTLLIADLWDIVLAGLLGGRLFGFGRRSFSSSARLRLSPRGGSLLGFSRSMARSPSPFGWFSRRRTALGGWEVEREVESAAPSSLLLSPCLCVPSPYPSA